MSDSSSSSDSLKILGIIVGVVITASGWLWGLKFKRIAEGEKMAVDEKVLMGLYDQIDSLTEENQRLARKLRTLQPEKNEENDQ